MDALLAALSAGVACVTFLIGFANLRIHAERQRAIQRSDDISQEIIHSSGQGTILDDDVEATSASFSEAMHIDPVARWTLYAASSVSLISVLLFSLQVVIQKWRLAIDPVSWDHSFLSLLSMPLFSIMVTALGWADYAWVIKDLSRRRAESFMETVRKAMVLRREGRYNDALEQVSSLTPKLDRWAWLFAFRSNCLEHLGDYQEATRLARKASTLAPQNGWYLVQVARLLWEQNDAKEALEVANGAVDLLPGEPNVHGLRGVILDRLGKDEAALTDLEIALANSPKNVELIKARGASLVRSNIADLSIRTIEQIVGEGDEIFIAALRARAHTRLKKRDLEQAVNDLNIVISADENDSEAISYRALAFALLGDVQSAGDDISRYEGLPAPSNTVGVVEIGQTLFNLKRYDEALRKFSDYLQVLPDSRVALHWRGMTYEELGQVTKAIEDYERHLRKQPDDAHFLVHHGSLMIDVGLEDSALRDLNEAISLDEKSRYARGTRGSFLAVLGRHQEALSDFDYLVRQNPNDVASLVLRAQVFFELKKLKEALSDIQSAENIDPNYARIYGVRGIILMAQRNYEEALRSLNRANELDPDDSIVLANRAIVADNLGRRDEAIKDYDSAIKLNPASPRLYVQRGCSYFRSSNKLEALRDYNRALNIAPGYVNALTHRAEWYTDAGEDRKAIEDLTRVYDEDPTNRSILNRLAAAYAKVGDTDKAHLYMAKAIEGLAQAYNDNPTDLEILDQLTISYAKMGNTEKAHFYASKVLDRVSDQESEVRQVAYGWNNLGLAAESSMIFSALAKADPQNTMIALAYAISLCQMGNAIDAGQLFDELLTADEAGAVAAWEKLVTPSLLYKYEEVAVIWEAAISRVPKAP